MSLRPPHPSKVNRNTSFGVDVTEEWPTNRTKRGKAPTVRGKWNGRIFRWRRSSSRDLADRSNILCNIETLALINEARSVYRAAPGYPSRVITVILYSPLETSHPVVIKVRMVFFCMLHELLTKGMRFQTRVEVIVLKR